MNINQETFEAWLFSQPDSRTYNYSDNTGCLICSFVKETTNVKKVSAGGSTLTTDGEVLAFEGWIKSFMCKNIQTEIGYWGIPISNDYKTAKAIYVAMFGQPMVEIPMPEPIEQSRQLTSP